MALTPDDLPDDAETLKAMILAARAEAAVLRADKERLDAERARVRDIGERVIRLEESVRGTGGSAAAPATRASSTCSGSSQATRARSSAEIS